MMEVCKNSSIGFSHPWQAAVIFIFTFILISFRRFRLLPIGRPSAALTGAVLTVMLGVMSPEQAYKAVNWDTICLLLGMMIIAEHLRSAGLFERIAILTERIASPLRLLIVLSIVSALAAAILVNDPVCVIMTPLLLTICESRRLNPFPYLMALATSTNIGSTLTLTGNPQNMIVGNLSKIPYLKFVGMMAIPVTVSLIVNIVFLMIYYGRNLRCVNNSDNAEPTKNHIRIRAHRSLGIGLAGLGISCLGYVTGFSMAFSSLAGAVTVITFHRKDPGRLLARIEWSLLLFFAALFVVIGGLQTSGLAQAGTDWALQFVSGDLKNQIWNFSGITLIGSNIFSNVPFVIMASTTIEKLAHQELFWCLLAFVSTMAGNMTLVGAVANMIVAETAKERCPISFWDYARFGIPSTMISMVLGIGIIMLLFVP